MEFAPEHWDNFIEILFIKIIPLNRSTTLSLYRLLNLNPNSNGQRKPY